MAHIWVTTGIQWSSCTGSHPRGPIQEEMHSTVRECLSVSAAEQLCSNTRTTHWQFSSKVTPEHPVTAVLLLLVPQILPLPNSTLVLLVQDQTFSVLWGERKGWRCISSISIANCIQFTWMGWKRIRSWCSTWRSRKWVGQLIQSSAESSRKDCSCFDCSLLPGPGHIIWHLCLLGAAGDGTCLCAGTFLDWTRSSPAHPSSPPFTLHSLWQKSWWKLSRAATNTRTSSTVQVRAGLRAEFRIKLKKWASYC